MATTEFASYSNRANRTEVLRWTMMGPKIIHHLKSKVRVDDICRLEQIQIVLQQTELGMGAGARSIVDFSSARTTS
jgi:hypothetical protein